MSKEHLIDLISDRFKIEMVLNAHLWAKLSNNLMRKLSEQVSDRLTDTQCGATVMNQIINEPWSLSHGRYR